jgi:hypothetical protein
MWSEGVKPSQIHRKMLAQYGEIVLHKGRCASGWLGSKVAEQALMGDCSGHPTL